MQEYLSDELAIDSDNSRKMRQVENRVTKKRKLVFPRKPLSTFSSATQFHQSNLENLTPRYTGNQFRNAPYHAKDKDGILYNQITSGNSKIPLATVTTVENSVILNTAVPKRMLTSKLEVNPSKTDKTDTDVRNKYSDFFDWLCSDQVLEENYFDKKEYSFESNYSANPQVSVKERPVNLQLPTTKVYSDARSSGIGTCFEIKRKKNLIQKNFSSTEKCKSSTW